jgi:hypothetical protein
MSYEEYDCIYIQGGVWVWHVTVGQNSGLHDCNTITS